MKVSRKFILAAVALVLLCLKGFFVFEERQRENGLAAKAAINRALAERMMAQYGGGQIQQKETTRPFSDRAMRDLVPKAYPKPASEWKTNEKAIYQKLLSAGQFDLLVVPFQVQEYALDRPTRSLMTAELAVLIAKAQKINIPDPYLVARALGDGDRRLDPNEVYAFANKLGVKKIVWGYVGHDRKNHMALTIQVQERGSNGTLNPQTEVKTKNLENITFTDEQPPIEVFQTKLPEILAAIGVDSSLLDSSKPEAKIDSAELPTDPLDLAKETKNPAQDALNFQLLGYLTPDESERAMERFAEKSYLALLNVSPDSPDYRLLKARTLMMLGLRPGALQVLGEPISAEEKELFAALNGNLPDVEQYSSQIIPIIKKLIAKLDAYSLDRQYTSVGKNESIKSFETFKLPGKQWPYLMVRTFTERDSWAQFDNIAPKTILDQAFPIKDYSAESIFRGATTLGDTEKLQALADLSALNHVRKLLEIEPTKWCCQNTIDRPATVDYLNLIEAIGEDNLLRRATFFTEVQGSPERALDFLKRIENVYTDHPRFSVALAKAQNKKAEAVEAAEKEKLQKSAYVNTFNAFYWEQGQTGVSAFAFNLIPWTNHQDYGYLYNFYASDYPYRPFYSDQDEPGNPELAEANAEAALRNSTKYILPVLILNRDYTAVTKRDDKLDDLMKSIEGRFAGEPEIYQIKARNSLAKGDFQSAEKNYLEAIKSQPKVWQSYSDLGLLLFEQGQMEKAAKIYMDYPGFKKNSKENQVGISNYAYEAGSKFYWLGDFSVAKPLYEIASRKETGSQADITSRIGLQLLEGNYREALQGSLERAKHYNDMYAYRDYLGMLHAMGKSKAAWDAFNVLARQTNDPHIWETVLAGHRKEGRSETEITEWVNEKIKQNIGNGNNQAAISLLRAGVVDRIPTMKFSSALAEIALPVWKINYPKNFVVETSLNGLEHVILGPKTETEGSVPHFGNNGRVISKFQIKSHLVYFAEAYQVLRMENYISANALLREASTLYNISPDVLGYMLPYYALAVVKTGDVNGVEKFITDVTPQQKGYDYLLTRAVISGVGGKTEESIQSLKAALIKRPFTEMRPLQTEYEFADICRLLFEATGKTEYKALALDWAKKNQVFQPWSSWAYAMEAIYTNDKADRKRAIAMTTYLDPQSEMLKQIPEKEREAAIKEFKGKNPFLIKEKPDQQVGI